MNVSEPFVRRPVGTSLLAAGVLLLGAVAYHFLPVAPLPKVDFPTISVSAQEPGVDPATAASSLAAPLERRFAQIAGVSEITSVSSLGGSNITIQFDLNRDINGAARDVQSAIDAASGELPSGLPQPPSYRKANPSDAPIMVLAMTSDTQPLSEVYNLADQIIGQRISQLDGVSQVTIGGGANSAVRVQINPVALASMGLSLEDIRATLSQVNVLSPKGALDGPQQRFVIASNDQLTHAEQYQPIIVAQHNGAAVALRDVGTAIDAQANRDQADNLKSTAADQIKKVGVAKTTGLCAEVPAETTTTTSTTIPSNNSSQLDVPRSPSSDSSLNALPTVSRSTINTFVPGVGTTPGASSPQPTALVADVTKKPSVPGFVVHHRQGGSGRSWRWWASSG